MAKQTRQTKDSGLQVPQDMAFQDKFWSIERVSWIVLFILLVAAALGFTGGAGPLNKSVAANEQIKVEYEPFGRRVALTSMNVTLKNLQGNKAQLIMQRNLNDKYQIQRITPQPSDVKASEELITYEFTMPDGAKSMLITFAIKPDNTTIGGIGGKMGQTNDGFVKINQFIYP